VKRWSAQIETPYAELSQAERESDRDQVRRYLRSSSKHLRTTLSRKELPSPVIRFGQEFGMLGAGWWLVRTVSSDAVE
jgi:hypothetical protein